MKRNKQTEKFKKLKSLAREQRNYWGNRRESDIYYEWVPVEKPQFIGWESTLEFDPLILRNPNAEELKIVLQMVGGNKPQFFKSTTTLGAIRKAKHSYTAARDLYATNLNKRKLRNFHSPCLPGVLDISQFTLRHNYQELDPRLQKYFYGLTRYDWSGKPYINYYINQGAFPIRWLRIKVNKAYSNFKGIPKSDNWRRREEVDKILDDANYWSAKNGFSRDSWSSASDRAIKRKLIAKKFKAVLKKFHEDTFEYYEAKILS